MAEEEQNTGKKMAEEEKNTGKKKMAEEEKNTGKKKMVEEEKNTGKKKMVEEEKNTPGGNKVHRPYSDGSRWIPDEVVQSIVASSAQTGIRALGLGSRIGTTLTDPGFHKIHIDVSKRMYKNAKFFLLDDVLPGFKVVRPMLVKELRRGINGFKISVTRATRPPRREDRVICSGRPTDVMPRERRNKIYETLWYVGSANGIMCFNPKVFDNEQMILLFQYTTGTGVVKVILDEVEEEEPEDKEWKGGFTYWYGFGYLRATNDYKVVQIMSPPVPEGEEEEEESWRFKVYSFNRQVWREFNDDNGVRYTKIVSLGSMQWRNSILWIILTLDDYAILAFSLEHETFSVIPLPADDNGDWNWRTSKIAVVKDDSLAVMAVASSLEINIWAMGKDGRWGIMYRIGDQASSNIIPIGIVGDLAVFHARRSGSPLFHTHFYDLVKQMDTEADEVDDRVSSAVAPYCESILPLNPPPDVLASLARWTKN